MQILYVVVAAVVVAVASVFLSPVIGIIAFILLAGAGFALFGLLGGAGTLRTSSPEPTGRPRASRSGTETSNQRQGQD